MMHRASNRNNAKGKGLTREYSFEDLRSTFGTERRAFPPIRNTRRACVLAAHIRNDLLSTWGREQLSATGLLRSMRGQLPRQRSIRPWQDVSWRLRRNPPPSPRPLPPSRCNFFTHYSKTYVLYIVQSKILKKRKKKNKRNFGGGLKGGKRGFYH